jgi:hypothetical protein
MLELFIICNAEWASLLLPKVRYFFALLDEEEPSIATYTNIVLYSIILLY